MRGTDRRLAALAGILMLAAACAPHGTSCGGDDVERGRRLFVRHGCNGCHTIGVTGTPIGPPLDGIGRTHDRAWLEAWLHDPTNQRPLTHMPRIALPDDEAHALAAYLAALR
jgi:cytochrome c2